MMSCKVYRIGYRSSRIDGLMKVTQKSIMKLLELQAVFFGAVSFLVEYFTFRTRASVHLRRAFLEG